MVYRTERTVNDYNGVCNCIDDDIERFTIKGKEAQKWVRLLKAAKLHKAASIPLAILLSIFTFAGAAAIVAIRLYAAKLVKYDYEVTGPDTVVFIMRDEEIEKLRKKQENKK